MSLASIAPRPIFAVLLALLLAACSGASEKPAQAFAEASLEEALGAAADAWAAKGHPRPVLTFGGSYALADRIRKGERPDIFIPAGKRAIDPLVAANLVSRGKVDPLAENELVLVARADNEVALQIGPGFPLSRAFAEHKCLALPDPHTAPAGLYAREALQNLAVWDEVEFRTRFAPDESAAAKLVETGECSLGVVFATDALANESVRLVDDFSKEMYSPIIYLLARIDNRANAEADGFRRFLLSEDGRAILGRFGFGTKEGRGGN
jgi:molybdate transport system substrate-binding protein